MTVTVVICAFTLNRWADLVVAVQSCIDQSLTPDEIIVVVDHNDDLLNKARSEMPDVMVVPNAAAQGLSGSRNTGLAASSGDVVVFLDDDAYGEADWLARLIEPFMDQQVAGVGGWIVPVWPGEAPTWFPATFLWVLGCSYQGLPEDNGNIRNPIGANMAIRRRVFDSVGGFASGVGRTGRDRLGGEETELCIRYSSRFPDDRFVLSRTSIVHHRVTAERLTRRYFWSRCWAEGLSKAAVSSLVGSESALASERRHLARTLPLEAFGAIRAMKTDPRASVVRLGLILTGGALAVAGMLWGGVRLRHSPIRAEVGEPEAATDVVGVGAHHSDVRDCVTIVQYDVGKEAEFAAPGVRAGDRLWVEVVKGGRVVGVVELTAEANGLLPPTVVRLVDEFENVEYPSKTGVPDQSLPRATVVVPTIYRRTDELTRTVQTLLDQDYPDFEIVVVDNRPDGDGPPITEFLGTPQVRVVIERSPGISRARNRGVAESTGGFVAFTDDDAVVDSHWLRAMGERYVLDEEVGAVSGLVLPLELATAPQLWFEEFYGGFSRSFSPQVMKLGAHIDDGLFPYAPGSFGVGCNMSFRRSTLQRLGGFNSALGTGTPAKGGEDLAMFLSLIFANGTIVFEPSAVVRHEHRRTRRAFLDQVFDYGTGLTAMYTALILDDPRHLVEMVRRIPAGLRLLTRPRAQRSPSRTPSYPRSALVVQALGMAYGPLAYARSAVRSLSR